MVLLIAVALGLIGGLMRAKITGVRMRMIDIRHLWLVFVAYAPQFFAFYFTPTQELIPDHWIPFLLIGSQTFLLIFAWINRKVEGFLLLGFGLLCNFTAIALNGGFMPITPDNAQKLIPSGSNFVLELGERVGLGKDILLLKEETVLWFLGDAFTLPTWMCYPLAFSIGDILIGMGAFWLLWELGRPQKKPMEVSP
jgi:hypothetical protein